MSGKDCRWPPLEEPYAAALRECVGWVIEHYEVLGIIAAGRIIEGHPDPASDFDVYVIHAIEKRQRVQRFFHGVPCEIFINPPSAIRSYFQEEYRDRRPSTAHMLATGAIIVNTDPVVDGLVGEAKAYLDKKPEVSEKALNEIRYMAATHLEDAVDLEGRDPAASALMFARAIGAMLEYFFCTRGEYMPRAKDLFSHTMEVDAEIGTLARDAMVAASLEERQERALALADRVLGVRGFYEWDSELEDLG